MTMYQNWNMIPTSGSSGSSTTYPNWNQSSTNVNGPLSLSPSDESAALGLLGYLDKDELQRLLHNDEKLEDMIKDLPKLKAIEDEKDSLMASSKSIADYSLSKQSELVQTKAQLALTYKNAKDVFDQYQEIKKEMVSSKPMSMDTVLALLQTAAAESDEQGENIAEDFLQGKLKIEEFKQTFIRLKILAYSRRVKVEKLQEELAHVRQGSTAPSRPAPPVPQRDHLPQYVQQAYNAFATQLPYPVPNSAAWNAPAMTFGMPNTDYYKTPT